VRTHPVDKLLEQHCYTSAAGLLQLVRFYVFKCTHVKTHKLLQVLKNSLIIHEENTKKNHKRVVSVIQIHVDLHKLKL
jgi:hypothetical protein